MALIVVIISEGATTSINPSISLTFSLLHVQPCYVVQEQVHA